MATRIRSISMPLFALGALWLLSWTAPIAADSWHTSAVEASQAGTALLEPTSEPTPGERTVPVLPGWPQTMGFSVPYYPVGVVLADVDGDDDLEVIAGSTDYRLRVWHHDGTLAAGWPVTVEQQIQSKAAVADLDGDGDLEIIVNVKSGSLKVFHHDGTPAAGWPQVSGLTFGFLSPSVYDLDGDGTPEILVGGGTQVHAWYADGTAFPGFPQFVGGTITGTLAVGDVTGDDVPEIFAQRSNYLEGFQVDGTPLPGWPVYYGLSSSYAAPSIADLDGNGTKEILVVGYSFGNYSQVAAYNVDGTAVTGFPVTFGSLQTYGCPVVGDMEGDGDLEIFVAGKLDPPAFYAWDHTGTLLPGWPTAATYNMEGSAILANFDGDPMIESAIASNYGPGDIFGYNLDGSIVADFPIATMGACGPNSPELGDVDLDGDLDLAFTMLSGDVAIWDLSIPYDESAIEWGSWFHDDWNTNQYGFVPGVDPADAPERNEAPRMVMGAISSSPMTGTLEFSFNLAAAEAMEISILDITGRRVRLLHNGWLSAGTHTMQWRGQDDMGLSLPGGVYFIRLTDSIGQAHATRVVLTQ